MSLSQRAGSEPLRVVDLWKAILPADTDRASALAALPERELAEAERMLSQTERARFIAGRVLRRRILSDYLGVPADQIRFDSEPNGKPRIVGAAGANVHFSAAHSSDLLVLAVTRDVAVGVDVEVIRAIDRFPDATVLIFDRLETEVGAELDAAELNRRFFERWTAVEAVAKLTGDGVWMSLADLEAPPAVAVMPLPLEPVYVGHVAVRSTGRVELRDRGWVAI